METATYLVYLTTHDGHELCFEVDEVSISAAMTVARVWHPGCQISDAEIVRGSKRPAPDPTTVAGARYYTGQ